MLDERVGNDTENGNANQVELAVWRDMIQMFKLSSLIMDIDRPKLWSLQFPDFIIPGHFKELAEVITFMALLKALVVSWEIPISKDVP